MRAGRGAVQAAHGRRQMIRERIAEQDHQSHNPKMLRLQEEERRPVAALIDDEQPIMVGGVLARNNGRSAAERKGNTPTAAFGYAEQFGVGRPGEQVGAFGIGE